MGRADKIEAEFPPGTIMPADLRRLCDYLDRTDYPISGHMRLRPEGRALKAWFGDDADAANQFAGFGAGPDGSILAFWHQYPKTLALGYNQDPVAASYEAFLVAEHMLAGQKPVVNNIFYPVPTITKSNFKTWYKPNMTTSSGCVPESPGGRATSDSYFNAFFPKGSKLTKAVKP